MITCLLTLVAASLGSALGCRDTLAPVAHLPHAPEARIHITVPAGGQRGDTIAIALDVTSAGGDTATATQGTFRFRPAALRFLGQPALDTLFPVLAVDPADSAAGNLRVLAVDPRGLPVHGLVLLFEVRNSGYAEGLAYTHELGVTASDILDNGGRAEVVPGTVRRPAAVVPGGWPSALRETALRARLIDSVPTGRRYGDVDGNGLINVLDVAWVANWAVGNQARAGQPIPVVGDLRELVGNVAPGNLPGLGENDDPKGPGWDAFCQRRLDVLDAAEIGNEAVRNWRPVVGDTIPASAVDPATGRPRRGSACQVMVPALPPDGIDKALWDSFFLPANLLKTPEGYDFAPRDLITVVFYNSATQAEKQAVMDAIGGEVVGGAFLSAGGIYHVKIPPVTTSSELLAITKVVEAFPQVNFAGIARNLDPQYRSPVVPPVPPDGFDPALRASFFDPENMLRTPEGYVFAPRNLIQIGFKRTATLAEKRAVIDALRGAVVGGSRIDAGAFYYVKIAPVTSIDELLATLRLVESFRQVDHALIAGEDDPNSSPALAQPRAP
ncbi:MAG: hypothetical protein IPK12_03735 [Gemmatimonadetes bacterium]|nr:hypothetical protein [Gemmatimonadota bacterium]